MKALVLLGLLGVNAVHASDWHMEIGAGQTAYRTYGDGIWYQIGSPHHLDAHGKFGLIGFTGRLNDAWDWHADYVNFGKASASCWCTSDKNYDAGSHSVINGQYPVKPAYFNGSGSLQGIQLKVQRWFDVGQASIGPDVGLLIYQNRWTETVYDWTSETWSTPINGVHQADRKVRIGGIVGMSIKTGKFSISIDQYLMKPVSLKGDNPPLWRNAYAAYVSYEL